MQRHRDEHKKTRKSEAWGREGLYVRWTLDGFFSRGEANLLVMQLVFINGFLPYVAGVC